MALKMKELPEQERPYEKCLKQGSAFLSDAELLAVILRTGTGGETSVDLARKVLMETGCDGNLAGLMRADFQKLKKIKGIGKVKALQLLCIAELSRRIARTSLGEKRLFQNAVEIARYYMEELRYCDQEQVMVMSFNTKGRLLAEKAVTRGTVNQSVVSPREVFLEALRNQASYIVLVHNHPSGDASPSQEDYQVTERIARAGTILGIELMDHVIIGDMCYYSFREHDMYPDTQKNRKADEGC